MNECYRGWYLITVGREIELQIKHGQLLIFALRSGWIMKRWREFEFLPAPFLRESNAFRLTVTLDARRRWDSFISRARNWILRIV